MTDLIIRNSKTKELILYRNIEGVYFLMENDIVVHNSLNYDEISDLFNTKERG